jgi:hypothetical protein
MTKKELLYIMSLLTRIKPQDEHVRKALAYCQKDIAQYDARRGQLKDQYEVDSFGW